MTFEELIKLCSDRGEPFQSIIRKTDGSYQASLRSGYDQANAFCCDTGLTPTLALEAVARQRGHLKPKDEKPNVEDLI